MPADLPTMPLQSCWLNERDSHTEAAFAHTKAWVLADLNDAYMDEKAREEAIAAIFAENNVEVIFENEENSKAD